MEPFLDPTYELGDQNVRLHLTGLCIESVPFLLFKNDLKKIEFAAQYIGHDKHCLDENN
jgi:hypothetical protein